MTQAMNYVGSIGRTLQAHTGYDMVLVDGRYRLTCLLYSRRFLSRDGKALIHDFTPRPLGSIKDIWSGRFEQWSRALKHYHLEQQNDTLAMMKPLQDTIITERELVQALRLPDR